MLGSPSSGRRQSVIAEEAGDDDIPGRKPSVSVQPRQKLGATTLSRPQDASTISLMRHGTNNSLRRQTTMNNEASDNVLDDQSMAVLQRDATFRYQKAQIRILQDELASLSETRTKLQAKHDATADEVERMRLDHAALTEQVEQMQALLDKNKSLQGIQEAKQRMLETDIASAKAQVANTRKNEKHLVRTAKVAEVRLNEGTEELRALKKELEDEKTNQGGLAVPRHEHERLLNEHQRLEKHKAELIAAFKQQIHLIDVLKRQKIHLEVSKCTDFSTD
ncbi:hypothetical protein, variant 3 [Aphanomyces invadans]|uniref:Uncharacterized protein n=1 Tax=Aphanomyces invadans TaxID=157072 RepID=A0A024UP39_9STRA|nr:hypothetical protein, variant 2 [Aphanomyces invadans]XP_008863710.1 hypothetical protein, variant 3 [Aphanomyces invadans]ETW07616.1 hypothetical protein, variant 2 [Aphanomyces invadans]ETW07617.1 hypothetical protein, variant 3 [Aphanomyces invadans]|eukprot:XP_008863709.1 hypothetical protein, variant 2 [Aphanomyces invadans]